MADPAGRLTPAPPTARTRATTVSALFLAALRIAPDKTFLAMEAATELIMTREFFENVLRPEGDGVTRQGSGRPSGHWTRRTSNPRGRNIPLMTPLTRCFNPRPGAGRASSPGPSLRTASISPSVLSLTQG